MTMLLALSVHMRNDLSLVDHARVGSTVDARIMVPYALWLGGDEIWGVVDVDVGEKLK